VLVVAKLGGDLAARAGQPAVLGELVAGVLLGNLGVAGFHALDWMARDPALEVLAELGVVVLLFQVGLESTVGQMARVGTSAFLVAVIGVVVPFGIGWGVGAMLLPDHSAYVHAFLGATLSATSVGITARVLKDLGRSHGQEARIVLGAAVIDDVLGLVILAVVSGVIEGAGRGGGMSWVALGGVVGKALAFLVGATLVGLAVSRRLYHVAARLRAAGLLLAFGLAFCFALAWIAALVGLAPIVGAFAAGLVFEEEHASPLTSRGEHPLSEQIEPVAAFLVPVFFVSMGMRTDLRAFGDPGVLALAGALTVAAVAGKLAAGAGGIGRGLDRLSIGIGMVPRGEVGLIFANVGLGLSIGGERIVDLATYSAVVVMVIVTTLVTPPALKWSLSRGGRVGAAPTR
jgi:Kef-type K+ transport system membrane component KefB